MSSRGQGSGARGSEACGGVEAGVVTTTETEVVDVFPTHLPSKVASCCCEHADTS